MCSQIPNIETRFTQPDGWQWGIFEPPARHEKQEIIQLRYGYWPQETPDIARGIVVIQGGFSEYAEKYFEAARWWHAKGFTVYSMDWHGQGGSSRYIAQHPHRASSSGFDHDVADLKDFITRILPKQSPVIAPVILCGHSMGGHIGLRILAEHPTLFHAAVFSAPMVDIFLKPSERGWVELAAKTAVKLGLGNHYAPGKGDYHDQMDPPAGQDDLSHDAVRGNLKRYWFSEKPALALGGQTWRWVAEAFKSIRILRNPELIQRIAIPVLFGIAGEDKVVDIPAIERVAAQTRHHRVLTIPGAWHELWMESDSLRTPWLTAVEDFINHNLPAPSTRVIPPSSPHKGLTP